MTQATVTIRSELDRQRIAKWAKNVAAGTTVTFRERRRSDDQNELMWALLTEIAQQVEWYGVKLSKDDWKDVLTASLRKARVVPGIDAGTFVPLGMRTSRMSKAEMSDLIELIYAFGAQHNVKFEARAA